jgi:zinc D-Ala-D-Ala carboxypeptidase
MKRSLRQVRFAGLSIAMLLLTLAGAARAQCRVEGWTAAAEANTQSLATLAWAPFGRAEAGWEAYVPLISRETGTDCPPQSEGFAAAMAAWQGAHGLVASGVMGEPDFLVMKAEVQARRPFLAVTSAGGCPETADVIAAAHAAESLGGKTVWARPSVLAAYRAMVAAARAEAPQIADDPRNLAIFSGYRSPTLDAARCMAEGNCDGVARARCSSHRTGLALDLFVGQAEGFGADSTAPESRLALSNALTYSWLLANAGRFGFVNYPFEPWHWEWTGEAP